MAKSIMIVGVGGQGTLLASKIIGRVLVDRGFDVKLSEVHGMSQRGGSVVTYVKYGKRVFSPMVDLGEADYMLSFEALESARWLPYLKKDGILIANTAQIWPMPVINGTMKYPDGILDKLSQSSRVVCVDALSLAIRAGSAKAVNTVLLGALSSASEVPTDAWLSAIEATVPARFIEVNKNAFMLGREIQI